MKLNWKSSNLKQNINKTIVSCALVGIATVSFAAKDKGPVKGQQRIIGGVESAADAWPFMTALVGAGNDALSGQFCGASYIGDNYIITASHCVDGADPADLEVVIGIHTLSNEASEGERIAVSEIIMHEDYNSATTDNDIALLVLESEPANAQAVNLISEEQMAELNNGDLMTVMGWGTRTPGSQDSADTLHEVEVALYDQQQCNTDYSNGVTDTMVCAGFAEGGRDSCQGDSGGPLVIEINEEWYQTGIVSWGLGCAQPNAPGVYARVAYFDSWLAGKLSGISASKAQNYGIVEVGFNADMEFNLNNGPDASLNVGTVTISDATNLSQPTIESDSCTGATLAVDAECSVVVNVVADTAGEASFAISYPTDNTDVGAVVDRTNLTVVPETTFDAASAADMPGLKFYTPSSLGWESQSDSTSTGASALQSPVALEDNQSSILLTVVEGPGTFSFDYRVSSETNYDFFEVSVDGELVLSESGNMDEFVNQEIELSAGTHRITFEYIKDFSVSEFEDRAYIDNVVAPNIDNGGGGSSGGGSMGWIALALLSLIRARRFKA